MKRNNIFKNSLTKERIECIIESIISDNKIDPCGGESSDALKVIAMAPMAATKLYLSYEIPIKTVEYSIEVVQKILAATNKILCITYTTFNKYLYSLMDAYLPFIINGKYRKVIATWPYYSQYMIYKMEDKIFNLLETELPEETMEKGIYNGAKIITFRENGDRYMLLHDRKGILIFKEIEVNMLGKAFVFDTRIKDENHYSECNMRLINSEIIVDNKRVVIPISPINRNDIEEIAETLKTE